LKKPVPSAGFFLFTPIRHSSGRLRRHLAVTPSPFLALRAEGGRKLSDAAGRPAASLPGSSFLIILTHRGSACRARNSSYGRSCL